MSRLDRMFAAMKHRSSLTAFGIATAAFVIAFVAQPALAALIDAVGGERVVTIVAEPASGVARSRARFQRQGARRARRRDAR